MLNVSNVINKKTVKMTWQFLFDIIIRNVFEVSNEQGGGAWLCHYEVPGLKGSNTSGFVVVDDDDVINAESCCSM